MNSEALAQSIAQALLNNDIEAALSQLDAIPKTDLTWENCQLKGVLLGISNRFSQAHDAFENAVALNPKEASILADWAEIYLKQDEVETAKKLLHQAIQKSPTLGNIHFQLGMAYFMANEFKEAHPYFDQAIALLPQESSPITLKARTQLALNNPTDAAQLFSKAIALNPKDIEAHYFAAEAALILGNISDSMSHYQSVLEISPTHESAIQQLGLLYFHNSYYKEALPLFKKALSIDPKNTEFQFRYASCLLEMGESQKAIGALDSMIKVDPGNVVILCTKALAQSRLKLMSDAMTTLKQASTLMPTHFMPYQYMGLILIQSEKYTEALKPLSKAIDLNPNNAELYGSKGTCLIALKQFKDAIDVYKKAISLSSHIMYKFILGTVLQETGNVSGAKACYEACLEQNPKFNEAKQALRGLG